MDLRASDRRTTDIMLPCTMLGHAEWAILCDVSPSGCRIELFDGRVPLRGATIVFEIGDPLYVAGTIVWVNGSEAGVRFSDALDPQVMRVLEI